MNKTEFPKPSIYHLDMDVDPPIKTSPAAYDFSAVNDWFQRCISAKPHSKDFRSVRAWGYAEIDWFDKWFSQFKEKDE